MRYLAEEPSVPVFACRRNTGALWERRPDQDRLPAGSSFPGNANMKRKVLCTLLALIGSGSAQGNPTGGTVISGGATFNHSGNVLEITNSANAIIHWDQFSIGAGELTRFVQPGAASAVLNRVIGQDPSQILGSLQSNGRVLLINPNGVVFGQGAQIDVAGLVASTLNLSDTDFLKGTFRFAGAGGEVQNGAVIRTAKGGFVYLIGGRVENSGTIESGNVVLAAGERVTLVDAMTPDISVQVEASEVPDLLARVQQDGVYSVLNTGRVSATRAVQENGRIVLRAAGANTVAGNVAGDRIQISGDAVTVKAGAAVQGGAEVTVGGGEHGAPMAPGVVNARLTSVEAGASVTAAAEGGRIVVWGDAARVAGSLSTGRQGHVETSGHWIDVSGMQLDTRGGTWLLDPYDMEVVAGGSTYLADPPPNVVIIGDGPGPVSQVDASFISSTLNGGNTVILDTSGGTPSTPGVGNIAIKAPVSSTNPSGNLILHADNDVVVDGMAGGSISLPNASVEIDAAGSVSQAPGGTIAASQLGVIAGGSVILNDPGNNFASVAVQANGSVDLHTTNSTTVGTVWTNGTVVNGIDTMGGSLKLVSDAAVTITAGNPIDAGSGDIGISGSTVQIDDYLSGNNVELIAGAGGVNAPGAISSATLAVRSGGSVTATHAFNSFGFITVDAPGQTVELGTTSAAMIVSRPLDGYTGAVAQDLTLDTGSLSQQAGATLNVSSLSLSAGAAIDLHTNGAGNQIGTLLAVDAGGKIAIRDDGGGLYVNGNISTTGTGNDGQIFLRTAGGNLELGPFSSLAALGGTGDSVVLATDSDFVNMYFVTPSAGAGRWLIYANDPDSTGFMPGGLTGGNLYDCPLTTCMPGGAITGSVSGNRFVWIFKPTITVTAGSWARTYGDVNPANSVTISGIRPGDDTSLNGAHGDGSALPASETLSGTVSISAPAQYDDAGMYLLTPAGLVSAQRYGISYGDGSGTVTQRTVDLTASGSKVYDGSTLFSTPTWSLAGLVNGDVVGASGSATFASEDVSGGPIAFSSFGSVSLSGAKAGNYTVGTMSGSGYITPKTLTVNVDVADKIYDGMTAASLQSAPTLTGAVGADVVSFVPGTVAFLDKNVGANKTVDLTGGALSGMDSGNYTFLAPASTTASITPRTLTVSATGSSKVYDGTTLAMVTATDDRLGGDSLTLIYTADYDDKNAGTGKMITLSGITLGGADAGNYALGTPSVATSGDITPKTLNTVFSGSDKVYDGTSAATVSVTDNRIAADDVTLAFGASFADKNVGTGKTITVSGITLAGADAGNYTLGATSASTTADISPRVLSVSGVTVSDKVYDGTVAAAFSGTPSVSGMVSGDDVNFVGATAAFADKNVGSDKPVFLSGGTLGGTDAGNYTLSGSPTSATASITPRSLVVTAAGGSRVYDGTLVANVTLADNRVSGDSLVLTANASYNDKNVGTAKPVSVAGISMTGIDAGNYTLATTRVDTTGNIAPRPVGIDGLQAADKVYDGTAHAQISGAPSVAGVLGGDSVAIDGTVASASFGDKNAGTDKPVFVTGLSLIGPDAGNYTLAGAATTTADIVPRPLSVTAHDDNITTGQTPYAGGAGVSYTGFVPGDDASVLSGTIFYGGDSQGASAPGRYSILPGGLASGNYRLDYLPGTLTITRTESATLSDGPQRELVTSTNNMASIGSDPLAGPSAGNVAMSGVSGASRPLPDRAPRDRIGGNRDDGSTAGDRRDEAPGADRDGDRAASPARKPLPECRA